MKSNSFIQNNILKLRKAKNMSQSSFAELFKVSRATIGAYEEGRAEPKLETILNIAKHFKIDPGRFIANNMSINEINGFRHINTEQKKVPVYKTEEAIESGQSKDHWNLPPTTNFSFITENSFSKIPQFNEKTLLFWTKISIDNVFTCNNQFIMLQNEQNIITGKLNSISNGILHIDCFTQTKDVQIKKLLKLHKLEKVLVNFDYHEK